MKYALALYFALVFATCFSDKWAGCSIISRSPYRIKSVKSWNMRQAPLVEYEWTDFTGTKNLDYGLTAKHNTRSAYFDIQGTNSQATIFLNGNADRVNAVLLSENDGKYQRIPFEPISKIDLLPDMLIFLAVSKSDLVDVRECLNSIVAVLGAGLSREHLDPTKVAPCQDCAISSGVIEKIDWSHQNPPNFASPESIINMLNMASTSIRQNLFGNPFPPFQNERISPRSTEHQNTIILSDDESHFTPDDWSQSVLHYPPSPAPSSSPVARGPPTIANPEDSSFQSFDLAPSHMAAFGIESMSASALPRGSPTARATPRRHSMSMMAATAEDSGTDTNAEAARSSTCKALLRQFIKDKQAGILPRKTSSTGARNRARVIPPVPLFEPESSVQPPVPTSSQDTAKAPPKTSNFSISSLVNADDQEPKKTNGKGKIPISSLLN